MDGCRGVIAGRIRNAVNQMAENLLGYLREWMFGTFCKRVLIERATRVTAADERGSLRSQLSHPIKKRKMCRLGKERGRRSCALPR